jgi:hypothetical protein
MNLINEFNLQRYERELISKKDSAIKGQIRALADYVCRGEIHEDYIDKALKKFEFGYIYRDTENLVGFVLWRVHNHLQFNKVLHIELICGRGLGLWMMKDVEQVALRQKITIITLDPANEKLKQVYINKYGFKVKYRLKPKEKNTYYKNIQNNTFYLQNSSNTKKNNGRLYTPKRIKKNNSKRYTLKQRHQTINENSINNFIKGATSRTNRIINLNNL